MIDYSEIRSQFECKEHTTILTYLITANDARQYRYQCIKCGEVVGKHSIKYSDLSERDKSLARPYDDAFRQSKFSERLAMERAAVEAINTERSLTWWAKYNEYLLSPEWESKRRRVLDRDNHRCTARLKDCEAVATQAHHLTYDHVFNEPLFDLTSVCNHCHDAITLMDRERRQR